MSAKVQNVAPRFRLRLRRDKIGAVKRAACARLIHQNHSYAHLLSKSPLPELVFPPAPQALRSNGRGCRVIKAAKAKNDIFAITVNENTILGVVPADLERSAAARAEEVVK